MTVVSRLNAAHVPMPHIVIRHQGVDRHQPVQRAGAIMSRIIVIAAARPSITPESTTRSS